MYKIIFRTLLVFVCFGISFAAVAVDYTARGAHSKKTVSHKVETNQCSDKDIRAIKKFDRKAKNEIEKWYETNEFSSQIVRGTTGMTTRELIKMSKKMDTEELLRENFFVSNRYRAMKVVYKRCDRKRPMIQTPSVFWLPEQFQGVLGTDVTPG